MVIHGIIDTGCTTSCVDIKVIPEEYIVKSKTVVHNLDSSGNIKILSRELPLDTYIKLNNQKYKLNQCRVNSIDHGTGT